MLPGCGKDELLKVRPAVFERISKLLILIKHLKKEKEKKRGLLEYFVNEMDHYIFFCIKSFDIWVDNGS